MIWHVFDEAFQPEPIKLFDRKSTEQTDAWVSTIGVLKLTGNPMIAKAPKL
jgi:hypothetical protein